MYDTGLETARPSAVALLKPQGLVRNGLVAEYRFDESKNLLKYSQQFDNAAWTKTDCAIAANDTAAPDGTTTADKVTLTVGAAQSIAGTYTVVAATTYTFSIWVKLGTATALKYAIYDVSNSGDIVAATSYSATTSWARYAITFTTPAGCTSVSIRPVKDSAQDNGTTAWIWGAQLEAGSVARTYYPTTDKQLLMDYSRPRKNLLLPNQANACEDGTIDGHGATGATVSVESTIYWQGSKSLKVVTNNAAADEGYYTYPYIFNLLPSTTYTATVRVRGSGTIRLQLSERKDDTTVVGTTTSSTYTLSDEWQEVSISRTLGASGRCAIIRITTPTKQAATFYVDGLQLEEGSTATAWEAPPNIGICGSTTGSDTNDPTYTGEGASFTTDDYIACPNISTINTTITVFYTSQITTANGGGTLFSFTSGATTFGGIMFSAGTSAWDDEVITYFNHGGKTAYRAGTIAAGWHILVTRWNGTKYDLILDGVNLATSTDGTPAPVTNGTAYKIGARSSPAVYLSGVVAFHAVYNRSISNVEESQNRAYLKSYLLRERGIQLS